jgi:hypothetical protein
MEIRQAQKYIDKSFSIMFHLIESFKDDELEKILKEGEYDMNGVDLRNILYYNVNQLIDELLDIRRKQVKKSMKNLFTEYMDLV